MAHIEVERRSVSIEKWSKLVFEGVEKRIFTQSIPIDGWQVRDAEYFPEGYRWESEFRPIGEGEVWGGPDVTCVFQCDFAIPESLDGQRVWLYQFTASEVMISDNDSYIGGLDPNRAWCSYLECARAGEKHHMKLECYTRSKPDDDRGMARNLKGCLHHFSRPRLVVIDEGMLALKYDLDMLYQSAYAAYMEDSAKAYYQYHVENILKLFPAYEGASEQEFKEAVPAIREYLHDTVFKGSMRFGKNGKLACVAHSHLDLAYHWTMGQTIQKNARTVLIQLKLMEQYPEYHYSHTQAWVYDSLKQYYPDLFEQVKKRIAEGRWEVVGAPFVEPDCNLISAESMARQMIYGKAFFRKEFNLDVDIAWLPDVFGNSAIMPQILRQAGVDYFVSNKMSTWNDTNRFPHNNFIWKGIDGTEINACVPPVHFNSWMDPNQAIRNWESFQDKNICDESLQMFGYGDGGSGITMEMLEYYYRQKSMGGIPQLRLTTGKEYLHSAFSDTSKFAVWDGDLYLEMHRGTFTNKGALKRWNRKGEFMAQRAETAAAMAAIATRSKVISQQELEEPWKKLLFNQFHDILPGSHTAPVTVDALRTYQEMEQSFNELENRAVNVWADGKDGGAISYLAINPLSDHANVMYMEDSEDEIPGGLTDGTSIFPVQRIVHADGSRELAVLTEQTGLSVKKYWPAENALVMTAADNGMAVTERSMENRFCKLEFDENGNLASVYDKNHGRRVNQDGAFLNQWQLFEDCPGTYNAWDIVRTYKNNEWILDGWTNCEIVENGPVSVAIRQEKEFFSSRAVQVVRLYAHSARIDFDTWIDWRESERLLKVAFPVCVKAPHYTTDTSAGSQEWANNKNTTWEQARFEVPCHKWVDLSEGMFGVSVLNDCKYGCDVEDNVIRLSLLKAAIRPDRESDRGEHRFVYSLYSHSGCMQADGVIESAYELNFPIKMKAGTWGKIADKKNDDRESLVIFNVNNPQFKVQAFKQAEDGTGDIVLRLVEVYGSHGELRLESRKELQSAWICNLLEEKVSDVMFDSHEVTCFMHPYEIVSIRMKLK